MNPARWHRPGWPRPRHRGALAGALFAVAAGLLTAGAQGGGNLSWHVVAGGGGRSSSARGALAGTVGQAVTGASVGSAGALGHGFWARAPAGSNPTPPTGTPTFPTPTATPSADLVVNTTTDEFDGACDAAGCSLREAITVANERPGPDTITFAIPSEDPGCTGGACTLTLERYLPPFTDDGTVVDGYSQPGARANTSGPGAPGDAVLRIGLDGAGVEGFPNGLEIRASAVTLRGLSITGFYTGVNVWSGAGAHLDGNYIGVRPDGVTAAGNTCTGISINGAGTPTDTLVGGPTPSERNVIAANECGGIDVGPGSGVRIAGNFVGLNALGAASGNGGAGVRFFSGAQMATVGGVAVGEANRIGYNDTYGVVLDGGFGAVERITLMRNRIWANGSGAIQRIAPANGDVAAPTITSASAASAIGTACGGCLVELFSDDSDQAAIYEGQARADTEGHWTIAHAPRLTGPNLTATTTDADGNTSDLSERWALAAGPTPSSTPSASPTTAPQATPTASGGVRHLFLPRALLGSASTPSRVALPALDVSR